MENTNNIKKYIIMCGGKYEQWKTPKHLLKVKGEVIVERTIRLLKNNGITDISISTDNPAFEYLGLPILKHNNSYKYENHKITGYWCDAFYPTNEPTCYIFGDVYFSENAIKTIVETKTNDIEFFGSMPPFAKNYPKKWVEPFALKVENTDHLKQAIEKTKKLDDEGKFWRKPIMWELWTVIKDLPLQTKPDQYIYNYVAINDYTSDIDDNKDIIKLECFLGGGNMIKVEVIRDFNLNMGMFSQLENIVRFNPCNKEEGRLYKNDIFECNDKIVDYLTGKNDNNLTVVKVIEVIPEKKEKIKETIIEEKMPDPIPEPKKTTRKRKVSKK